MIPFLSPGFQALPDNPAFGSPNSTPFAPPGGGLLGRLGLSPEMIAQLRAKLQAMPPGDAGGRMDMLREQLMAFPDLKAKLLALGRPQSPGVQDMGAPPNAAGPQPNANAGWQDGLNRGMQKRLEAGKELPPGIARRRPGAVGQSTGGGSAAAPRRARPAGGGDMQARQVPQGGGMIPYGGSDPGGDMRFPGFQTQAPAPAPAPAAPAAGPSGGGVNPDSFQNYRIRRMSGIVR